MHTLASRLPVKEATPRFYYKLSKKISCAKRIGNFVRLFLTFLFTQVGVILLIASYMLCGAALFQSIEENSLMGLAQEAEEVGVLL